MKPHHPPNPFRAFCLGFELYLACGLGLRALNPAPFRPTSSMSELSRRPGLSRAESPRRMSTRTCLVDGRKGLGFRVGFRV